MKKSLKVLRAIKNLTQEQAGALVGVSRNVWRSWEVGKVKPRIDHVKKIEEVFEVKYEELLFF